MIEFKIVGICPTCGSLRVRYNKKKEIHMCYACRAQCKALLLRSLPFRSGRCLHMDPIARLTSNYPQPENPHKQSYEVNDNTAKWRAMCGKHKDKNQTIMIFEKDPDPWRV